MCTITWWWRLLFLYPRYQGSRGVWKTLEENVGVTITPGSPQTQELCSSTLLNRCTSTETRWNKKNCLSLVAGMVTNFLDQKWEKVIYRLINSAESLDRNWRKKVVCCKTRILSYFLVAANSATDLASLAAEATQESAKGQTTVTSQTRDLPLCHGTTVSPSGLFPSEWHKPCGSFVLGIAADDRARATSSFRAWCRIDLPAAFLQTNVWRPNASTWVPQWHLCETHSSSPSRSPIATLTASSSSLMPHDVTGRCYNHRFRLFLASG